MLQLPSLELASFIAVPPYKHILNFSITRLPFSISESHPSFEHSRIPCKCVDELILPCVRGFLRFSAMPEQTRPRTRTTRKKTKKPKQISFHKFLRSLPRPYPDPYIEWHIGLYDTITILKRRLERMTHKPLLSHDDLLRLGVVRGAEFIIDEENPIDLGRRFFAPGSLYEVTECVKSFNENEEWRQPDSEHELDPTGYPLPDINQIGALSETCWSVVDWDKWDRRYSSLEERYTWRKNPNWVRPW